MIEGWIFGLLFGAILGFGTKAELDRKPCLVDQKGECVVVKGESK